MTHDEYRRAAVARMLAHPKDLYRRVSNGFAMATGECFNLESIIRNEIFTLRRQADELEAQLSSVYRSTTSWYETIKAERDEACK